MKPDHAQPEVVIDAVDVAVVDAQDDEAPARPQIAPLRSVASSTRRPASIPP